MSGDTPKAQNWIRFWRPGARLEPSLRVHGEGAGWNPVSCLDSNVAPQARTKRFHGATLPVRVLCGNRCGKAHGCTSPTNGRVLQIVLAVPRCSSLTPTSSMGGEKMSASSVWKSPRMQNFMKNWSTQQVGLEKSKSDISVCHRVSGRTGKRPLIVKFVRRHTNFELRTREKKPREPNSPV